MKNWHYSISSNSIWTSFDNGTVEAETLEEAKEKALVKLKYDFDKANTVFAACDITQEFKIEFDESLIKIE